MNLNRFALWFFLISILISCSSSKNTQLEKSQFSHLDSLLMNRNNTNYWSYPEYPVPVQTWDLKHQKIHLLLFPEQDSAAVVTDIFAVNKRVGQQNIQLDAVGLQIDSVVNLKGNEMMDWKSDSVSLTVNFSKRAFKGDSIFIRVYYSISHPESGLVFNHNRGFYTNVPTVVYADNEPDDIRRWLPTLDSPSQRATFELWLSVPETLNTIATGIQIESIGEENGRKTDYWILNQAQPPYLWAFVVGNYVSTAFLHQGKKVELFGESEFESYLPMMYSGVDSMLTFMEDFTSLPYPYDALKFVPIPEFDAMGMENTGMITLFQEAQFDSTMRGSLSNTDLLIHELAHQWYGDWVTVQDWSEITLQEGISVWFEYAFARYQKGIETKVERKWISWVNYLYETRNYKRPIITKQFEDPADLFDAHTYEKASLIFDLLEQELGEVAFQQVLKDWLQLPKDDITTKEFQKLVEQQSGKNCDTFFKQWFYKPGHPALSVRFDSDSSSTRIYLSQTQSKTKEPIYDLSIPIWAVNQQKIDSLTIRFTKQDTLIRLNQHYSDIWIDPHFTFPAQISQSLSNEQWKLRLAKAPQYILLQTLYQTNEQELSSEIKQQLMESVFQEYPSLVKEWFSAVLSSNYTATDRDFQIKLLQSNENGRIRMYAVFALVTDESIVVDSLLKAHFEQEKDVFIKAEILKSGLIRNADLWISDAITYAKMNSYQQIYQKAIVQGLYESANPQAFDVIYDLVKHQVKTSYMYDALETLISLGEIADNDTAFTLMIDVMKQKTDDPDISIKWFAFRTLSHFPEMNEWIDEKLSTVTEEERMAIHSMLKNYHDSLNSTVDSQNEEKKNDE